MSNKAQGMRSRREVDARGNCSKCGGKHYGSGWYCPMAEERIPTSDVEAIHGSAVEASLPQKPDPVATVAEDISEGLNNGSEARPVEPTAQHLATSKDSTLVQRLRERDRINAGSHETYQSARETLFAEAVAKIESQQRDLDAYCGIATETAQLRARLAEWERWTQGHVWIRSEEYAELCALKRSHGPNPLATGGFVATDPDATLADGIRASYESSGPETPLNDLGEKT